MPVGVPRPVGRRRSPLGDAQVVVAAGLPGRTGQRVGALDDVKQVDGVADNHVRAMPRPSIRTLLPDVATFRVILPVR
jgi:hypothetical protein